MSKKYNIEEIFRDGEHQKQVALRPEVWEKLERRLESDDAPKPSLKLWLVAASFILVATLSALLVLNIDQYHVEDLLINEQPYFTKDEIGDLNSYYVVENKLFVNPSYG